MVISLLGGDALNSPITTTSLASSSASGVTSVDAFRELYGRAVMRLEIDPVPGHPFELDFAIRAVPEFSIASGRLSPTVNRHPVSLIDNEDIVLVWVEQGSGSIRQFGREASISDGGAAFASNAEVGEFRGHSASQLHNFRFSRKMLCDMSVDIESAMARAIPHDNAALGLLTRYASVMDDFEAMASPQLRWAVVTHMHDLASVLLAGIQDIKQLDGRPGVRAAQLRAILDDIKQNLTARDLSPATVAQRHRLSTRTLRDLFKGQSTTFTDYVLEQRLELAHRRLTDHRHAGQTVSAIAFESGFGDISYFNHAFRRRYGLTPSDARVKATSDN
ncbi:AraC family transcriptional regulator [Mesorhizobium sp. BAC0120]|uniref:AraC family transcriptional regulator n=1 Tax=Mesorhizobium sp. BAC0120 TaxID=3090670 RepID=UPI00298C3F71|nr:AraC family transcriptional regulator [Mesorhizobium sp. BAC0120]MDW6023344.1 AraC family transcriptional regulator [Mesorhizobium sp. BAC0120]